MSHKIKQNVIGTTMDPGEGTRYIGYQRKKSCAKNGMKRVYGVVYKTGMKRLDQLAMK